MNEKKNLLMTKNKFLFGGDVQYANESYLWLNFNHFGLGYVDDKIDHIESEEKNQRIFKFDS